MNWQSFTSGTDAADAQSVDQISFDILRTLLASRQATSPTVRALVEATRGGDGTGATIAGSAGRVAMLNGRGTPDAQGHGSFFSVCGSDSIGDGPVAQDGEWHV